MVLILNSGKVVRFGPFELDVAKGELRRNGIRVRLQGQSLQILLLLLQSPGEVVSREALRERLWADTFVDFEHGLNTAVKKLRQVLGDNPENPIFIETVPRVGYRFMADVRAIGPEAIAPHQTISELPEAGSPGAPISARISGSRHWMWVLLPGAAAFIVLTPAYWYFTRPLAAPHVSNYSQLTLDGRKKDVIGEGGNTLFLNLVDPVGIGQVPSSGGTVVPVIPDLPSDSLPSGLTPGLWAVSPDGSSLLVRIYPYRSERVDDDDLWVVGVLGKPLAC